MDNGQTTTRKGFLMRSGLAIAGVFALGKASSAAPSRVQSGRGPAVQDSSVDALSARRLRPAKGTVRYES
jgi:hypothetical protein